MIQRFDKGDYTYHTYHTSNGHEFIDRVQLLFQGSLPVVLVGHLIAATALAISLDIFTPDTTAWFFWRLVMSWAVVRTVHMVAAREWISTETDARFHARVFTALTAGTAITWGIWGYLAMDPQYPIALALAVIVISGVVSGGVGSLSPYFPAFVVYGVGITVLPVTRLFVLEEDAYMIVGILATVLFLMNMFASYSHNRTIRETIHLRYRIAELVSGLKARAADAERANVAKIRFLSAAGHDLRQPLRAISLYTDLLEQQYDDFYASETLERIRQATSITTESLDQLLDLTQLETGVIVPHVGNIELQPILERMETMFLPVSESRGVKLQIRPTRAVVETDARLVERALQNLVGNALRYTPAGGRVFVGVRRRSGSWCIEVRDSGIGIDPDARDMIFEEFRQLHQPSGEGRSADSRKGLGLGLSIVKRITDLLNHPLEFTSQPGHGSTFRVFLPRAGVDQPPSILAGRGLVGMSCLFVDDDPVFRDFVPSSLRAWGAEVAVVEDIPAARRLLMDRPFDAVITDYHVAGDVCISLLDQVSATQGEACLVIIITADSGSDPVRAAGGRWPIFPKPLDPLQLVRVLDRLWQQAGAESDESRKRGEDAAIGPE